MNEVHWKDNVGIHQRSKDIVIFFKLCCFFVNSHELIEIPFLKQVQTKFHSFKLLNLKQCTLIYDLILNKPSLSSLSLVDYCNKYISFLTKKIRFFDNIIPTPYYEMKLQKVRMSTFLGSSTSATGREWTVRWFSTSSSSMLTRY